MKEREKSKNTSKVFGLRKWGRGIVIPLTDGREAGLEDKERQERFWINLRCL